MVFRNSNGSIDNAIINDRLIRSNVDGQSENSQSKASSTETSEARKDIDINLKGDKVGEAVIAAKRFKGTPTSGQQEAGNDPVKIHVNSEKTEWKSLDIAGSYFSS